MWIYPDHISMSQAIRRIMDTDHFAHTHTAEQFQQHWYIKKNCDCFNSIFLLETSPKLKIESRPGQIEEDEARTSQNLNELKEPKGVWGFFKDKDRSVFCYLKELFRLWKGKPYQETAVIQ